VNFAAVVSFIPLNWGVVPGNEIPIGTNVGSLSADATLGLINSACNQPLPVFFDMFNSSLDTGDTVSFDDLDNNGTADFAEILNRDQGNEHYESVLKYPDVAVRLFEDVVDKNGKFVGPIRRSSGISIVAGIPVLLQFLIFPPGSGIDEDLPSDFDLGYPTVTVLQNAGDPDIVPEPGAITDFCSPLSTENVTFATAPDDDEFGPGVKLFVNPGDGEHTFTTVSFGQRDVDGDGYENSLDTCPYDINVGSPKVTMDGDLDNDGLDAVCDPNDDPATGGVDSDEDADGYVNRQDNCPLIPNGEEETNQADEDSDQIGDVCDTDPEVEDGDLEFSRLEQVVTIGTGTGPGDPPSVEACLPQTCFRPSEDGSGNGNGDGDGSNTGVIIAIIVAVIAAVAIIGGGATMMMRRREG
jgi:hypothetical protein